MTDMEVEQPSAVLYKFTNKAESPYLDSILSMFYEGAYQNTLGIMEAWNIEADNEQLILVGVSADENGKPECYPIATILKAEDVRNFLAPDGNGGFFDPLNPTEAEEAKENMKAIKDAIEE